MNLILINNQNNNNNDQIQDNLRFYLSWQNFNLGNKVNSNQSMSNYLNNSIKIKI